MADIRSVPMSEEERSEFLGHGGTGILSFDTLDDDQPYSRPVSYGYDAETGISTSGSPLDPTTPERQIS